ncbi:MAG: hypothetical protein FWD78_00500 [Treponema sp.]|nr:hypothetical protein [Treponema sp.]
MKKALVILLILAVAGGVFAQINFTGTLSAGLVGVFNKDQDPTIGIRSPRNDSPLRFDLNGAWAKDDGLSGFNFTLRTEGTPGHNVFASTVAIDNLYGWVSLLDKMVTIYGGKTNNNGNFATVGGVQDNLATGVGDGFFARIVPMTGLEFGVGVYSRSYITTATGLGGLTLANARYNFGVAYTVPQVVTVIGLLRQGQNEPNAAHLADQTLDSGKFTDAGIGFKILSLTSVGITALNVDAYFFDLQQVAKFSTVKIGELLNYANGDLSAGIRFMQQFQIGDSAAKYADLTFVGNVQYLVNGFILPRLDVGFNMGTSGLGGIYSGMWNLVGKNGFSEKGMNLGIAPSVAFRYGNANNTLEFGYIFQKDLTANADNMRNSVYVEMKTSF